jgi:hydrogenase maturation factor
MPHGVLAKMRFPYSRITEKNDNMAAQEVVKYLQFLLRSMVWRGLNLCDKTIQHTISTNLHFCTDQSIADSAEENA